MSKLMRSEIEINGKMTVQRYLNWENTTSDHYEVESMVIVGPYPSKHFFVGPGSLSGCRRARSVRVTLVADDGWPLQKIKDIEKAFCKPGKKRSLSILRASDSSNLVHVKAYYIVWKRIGSKSRKRTLLLGSANASRQGFGGHCESFISLDLAAIKDSTDRQSVRDYFETIQEYASAGSAELLQVNPIWFWIGKGTSAWASLPAMTVKALDAEPSASTFIGWLRRGVLCHKFQPDNNFGKIKVTLRRPLPQGELQLLLEDSGFTTEGDQNSIVTPYLALANESGNTITSKFTESRPPAWLRALFIETRLGFWTSEECYAQHGRRFRSVGAGSRAEKLQRLRLASESQISSWLETAVNAVKLFRAKISEKWGVEVADSYFVEKGSFEEWLERFRVIARQKIARDRAKAADKEFRSRHVSGYEFFAMPQLGEDMREFVTSFCRTIELKNSGGKVMNLLASVVRDKFDTESEQCDLSAWMSRIWRDAEADDVTVGSFARSMRQALAGYHAGWGPKK